MQGVLSLHCDATEQVLHPSIASCAQTPLEQVSVVHPFWSSHSAAVSQRVQPGTDGLEHVPVWGSHWPAVWQLSCGWHWRGAPARHAPAWHVSAWVQAFPSLQLVPSAFAGLEQMPVCGSQVPALWHWSVVVQVTGFVPTQAPAWQESLWVQALPSLQLVPSAFAGFEQVPVCGSQVPALWHWSVAVQVTGFAPTQVPAWQESLWVQALPSLQLVPAGFAVFEQVPVCGSQVPVWH